MNRRDIGRATVLSPSDIGMPLSPRGNTPGLTGTRAIDGMPALEPDHRHGWHAEMGQHPGCVD